MSLEWVQHLRGKPSDCRGMLLLKQAAILEMLQVASGTEQLETEQICCIYSSF